MTVLARKRAIGVSAAWLAALALLLPGACAPVPPADDKEAMADYKEANDPAEPTNRVMYDVNTALDKAIMRPIAQGYRAVVPEAGRSGITFDLARLGDLEVPVLVDLDFLGAGGEHPGAEFGAHAVRLVHEGRFGEMVCFRPPDIASVPIADAIARLSRVDPRSSAVQPARALGIGFGDAPPDKGAVFTRCQAASGRYYLAIRALFAVVSSRRLGVKSRFDLPAQ